MHSVGMCYKATLSIYSIFQLLICLQVKTWLHVLNCTPCRVSWLTCAHLSCCAPYNLITPVAILCWHYITICFLCFGALGVWLGPALAYRVHVENFCSSAMSYQPETDSGPTTTPPASKQSLRSTNYQPGAPRKQRPEQDLSRWSLCDSPLGAIRGSIATAQANRPCATAWLEQQQADLHWGSSCGHPSLEKAIICARNLAAAPGPSHPVAAASTAAHTTPTLSPFSPAASAAISPAPRASPKVW